MTCIITVAAIFSSLFRATSCVSGDVRSISSEMRMLKQRDENGTLARTLILPKVPTNWEDFDNNYILISDSNSRLPITSITEAPKPSGVSVEVNRKRRRRKKKPEKYHQQERNGFKDPKFLNLFTIVKFTNDQCEDGGTCYHQSECQAKGGTPTAACANGFGICCQFETECGGSGPMDGEIFVGGTTAGVCTLTIEKKQCTKQMRFDFLHLEMEDPIDGSCVSERLLITGQNMNSVTPTICGSNSGQHMYADVDESKGPVMVSMISPEKRNFRIRVRQLCDGDPMLAPRNCLQYFTKSTGAIQSFNYRQSEDYLSSYMNNLNYAICIRKAPGMCSIVYSNIANNGEEFPFEMNNMDFDGALTVPPKEAGAEVFNCPDDYIVVANVRLCGQKLNDASVQLDYTKNYPITDTSGGPFNVQVVSDSAISGRGFRINYEQQSC